MNRHRHLAKRHPRRNTTVIDWLMMVTAVVYPLSGMPQAVQIFLSHNATGVSLLSWAGFLIFDIVELAYGIAHKIKPLILTGFLWIAVDGAVVVGILVYH
ncbi:MAG TPA: hypothetical protein VHQ86_06015 [Candidatus Saccharimonadia bacterium]|jgi:uncharacterized protein with PQ loop repeat|nr:hypothetical protein [Candidatus Saccharimonadia bacterium]